ncbi:MAG TPA: ATP-binding protein [Geobacteraceae bacterium]|nr:ATP-binding protein [Geobacteraceae bacterium]
MKLRLISKMTLSTSVLLLLSMTLFAWINVETLHTLLLEEAVSLADKLSETIIKTTHYQMLENDRKRVYEMISEVGTQKDIERVRLITKEGLTIFSTDKKEIGTYLDKTAEACNMCHRSDTPLLQASSMNRSRIFRNRDGKEVLGLAKAIYNEEKCYTAPCHFHPEGARILGVLDVNLSLDNMQSQLAANRYKITILTVFMLGLISLCMVFLIHEQINQPLKKLLNQTEKIAEGNLESAVAITSTDEIGELAAAFNIMTEKLKKAREELEDWGKNLEVKVEERTHELNRVQAQLVRSEKLASLGELVAGIAHEINNPLTGILVFTSLLNNDAKLHPALKSDLNTIVRETERCANIVRGLLDFSRESIPQKNRTSLNSIMDAALSLVRHQSMFQNVDIARDYNTAIPEVLVDHNQVEQVFVNMLLNAGQAMHEGGRLTIASGVTADGGSAFVTITDTGHGIPDEILSRIFDPFFTTKENKGTGLGLSVSYGIINNHGGTIEVQSTVGKGTSFSIILPIDAPEDDPQAAG